MTEVSATLALELEAVPCPLCGGGDIATLGWLGDVSLGVPGTFPLARCRGCGLLHQNPRVRDDDLPRAYPDNFPTAHKEASLGAFHNILNTGKKSITIDPRNERGRQLLLELIAGADIAAILVKAGLGTPEAVRNWLTAEFPRLADSEASRHF